MKLSKLMKPVWAGTIVASVAAMSLTLPASAQTTAPGTAPDTTTPSTTAPGTTPSTTTPDTTTGTTSDTTTTTTADTNNDGFDWGWLGLLGLIGLAGLARKHDDRPRYTKPTDPSVDPAASTRSDYYNR